jgi:UDP-glucose 4-epimerase
MPANPLSPYALQKFVGERYCKLYYDLYGLETVILRYFNVFGPDQDPHSEYSAVIPRFLSAILAREPITIYGDGEQSRDFTYVDNVVDANLLAMQTHDAAGKLFNIGCGQRITLNELIQLLERVLGSNSTVEHLAARPGDVRHSLADISLASRLLGYGPRVLVEEGLRMTIGAMRGTRLE